MAYLFPEDLRQLRVVLCHDWLTGMRGGERVLELLCDVFPDAPIVTLIHNRGAVSETINRHPITVSFLQRVPGILTHYRNYLPLFPAAINSLHAPPCDLVISTSHCVAKALRAPPGARHLCYCFTPMRYAWLFQEEYFGPNRLKRALTAPLLSTLRHWDRSSSSRVDRFVGISRHVQERIARFYGRTADVVYPPVNTDFWTPAPTHQDDFDLIVSALVPYKRIDLAVRAYNHTRRRLKIVGTGGECCALRALAGPTVELLGWQSDVIIRDLYRQCRLLVFPGEEDFGIVPIEAMACGKPVVAYARGGALETVVDGISGIFFKAQTAEAIAEAVQQCLIQTWDSPAIRRHAERFGHANFCHGLVESIRACQAQ